MMWLRRAMGMQDMEQQPPSPISPIENNPVGWSSTYAPEVLTNPSPDFSPLASSVMMTPEQKMGRFWNVATKQAKQAYTNADLPQLTKAGNEAYDSAAGFLNSTNPIRAFHGSPHTFDRFDLSKIGTGEGAQAYGHGLYFAGNEKVAQGYRDALGQNTGFRNLGFDVELGGKPLSEKGLSQDWKSAILHIKDAGDIERAWRQAPMVFTEKKYPEIRAIIDEIRGQGVSFKPAGSMYEVNLRTSPERLLDWDKPLAGQPAAVREALGAALPPHEVKKWGGLPHAFANNRMIELPSGDVTGREAYILARMGVGGNNSRVAASIASERLHKSGLDGIQYLDAGSRAAGDGSRNYVMFRDDIIDVLKRYGLFGLGMVGASQAGPYGEANP